MTRPFRWDSPGRALTVFWQKVVVLKHLFKRVVVRQQGVHGADVLNVQFAISPQVFSCAFVVQHQYRISGWLAQIALTVLNQ